MKTSIELRGDTEAAVDFLEAFRPGGPWYLVAIDPLLRGRLKAGSLRTGKRPRRLSTGGRGRYRAGTERFNYQELKGFNHG